MHSLENVEYYPTDQSTFKLLLKQAMIDLREQIEDDEDIKEGYYFFAIFKCAGANPDGKIQHNHSPNP